MESVNFLACRGLTGTAESKGMSDGQRMSLNIIYLFNMFGGQPHTLPHSSPSPSALSSFLLPCRAIFFIAGDLAQLKLPVGMQNLILYDTGVTGKAKLREWRSGEESS